MSTRKISKNSLRKQKNQNIAEPQNNIAGSQELTMMSAVNGIVNLAEDSKLSESFFCRADKFINHLSERQGITKIQAVLLSLFIEMGAFGRHHTFADIANTLGCNNVQMLQYTSDVNDLVRRGMIRKSRDMGGDDGAQLRPYIVMFGEYVDSMYVATKYVKRADIFVVVGTSLKVYPAANFINYAHREVPKFVIDPGEMEQCERLGFTHFKIGATEGMKMLVGALKDL